MSITRSQLDSYFRTLEVPLYNFALRWVFDAGLAEEIVQDAFVRIWNRRDTIESSTFKGLAYKTVQNLAFNELRKLKWRQSLNFAHWLGDGEAAADQDLIQRQDLIEMRRLLEAMPVDLKEVLLLSQYSDFSYQEIAASLGIAEGTVASRKNRALEWLRARMNGENHE